MTDGIKSICHKKYTDNMNIITKSSCYIWLSIICCITSCKQKPHFAYCIKEFELEDDTITINGKPLDLKVSDDNLTTVLVDSFLVIQEECVDGFLGVYNINNLTRKATLCPKGRAKNEFSNPFYLLSQAYIKDSCIFLTAVDKDCYAKEINLTQSMQRGITIVSAVSDCPSYNDNHVFLFIDNDVNKQFVNIYGEETMEPKHRNAEYSIINTKEKKKRALNVFPRPMDSDEESITNYAGGAMYKHPNKNLFVQECCFMDYLLFFDIDADTAFAVHVSGTPTFDDYAPDGRTITFSNGSTVTSNYVFAIHRTDKIDINGKKTRERRLLVFDWNGNLIANAIMNPGANQIVYDEKMKTLYGFDFSVGERILHKYDISKIIPETTR